MQGGAKKEVARDLIALGGVPFFVLVAVRVAILQNPAYLAQFVIGGALLLVLSFIFKSNLYSGLSLLIGVFLSIYYDDVLFTVFAGLAYVLILFSLAYLQRPMKSVWLGALFGAIATAVSYVLVRYLFK